MKPITEFPFSEQLLINGKYWWNRRTAESLSHPAEPCFQELLAICQNNKKLFQLIMTTIPTMHGWCTVEKACAMAALVLVMKPKTCIEIGVWGGRSFMPMAWAMKENGSGGVIGIDPYDSKASAKDQFAADEKWWSEQPHEQVRESFLSFVKNFRLQQFVTLVQVPSDDYKPVTCQLLHIDGNHCEQAQRDAERFGPKVELGGICILDDIQWVGGSVLRAIDTLEEMGFVERFRFAEQNWNIMQRIR